MVLAGSLATPGALLLLVSAGWVAAYVAFGLVLGVGMASLVGSRAASITGLLAFVLAISPLLLSLASWARCGALPVAALGRPSPPVCRSPAAARVPRRRAPEIGAWVAVPLALGGWRTVTRDA